MLARPTHKLLSLVAALSLILSMAVRAQSEDTPSAVANQYLATAQKLAQLWVDTRPWPAHYREYLDTTKQEFAPLLSQAALMELQARPPDGPKELRQPADDSEGGSRDVYQGMIACVAKAHFTVLSESIEGDKATVDVETTVPNPFGSGKTESFQDQLVLVRENGRWLLTPQAFKTFAF